MSQRKYDSTVARIAGNLLSGIAPQPNGGDRAAVAWAVNQAFAIVAEVKRKGRELEEEQFISENGTLPPSEMHRRETR